MRRHARTRSTLILVHRRPLLDQWLAQLALFLGLDRKAIGIIAGSKRSPNGQLDVAMMQSLVRRDSVADLVAAHDQVIADECHHLPAVQFERVLREVKANVDREVPMLLRMFEKRLRGYRAIGYARGEAPLG